MVVQNNIMALNAYRQSTLNNLQLASSLQKLSSGYRINSAADDPAGLAISERMRAQQTGVYRAMENAQDAMNLTRTAEGALTEVHSMLNRLTDLAGQAANGTLGDSQRATINKEAQDILSEINRVSKATNYNGINLLDGSLSGGSSRVDVSGGARVTETAPTAGHYDFAAMPDLTGLAAGDSVSFTLGTNDGNSRTLSFTVNSDLSGMTAADGTNYNFATTPAAGATTANISGADFASAVAGQLRNTPAANSFQITDSGAGLTLTNRDTGSAAPRVTGLSYSVNNGGYTDVAGTGTTGTDTVRTLDRDNLTVFDGTNESSAVFSVNGQKFALVDSANYANTVSQLSDRSVNVIQVDAASGSALDGGDLQGIAAQINLKTGLALEANGNNGITLKSPYDGNGLTMQVGDTANSYNQISVKVGDMSASGLGLNSISFLTQESSASALSRIKSAIDQVSGVRGELGALDNRLEYTVNNLGVTYENITASESRIRDTDMAKEMMKFTKRSLLAQVSQAMMAQANVQQQNVLQLLR